jgi:DNA-binding NtrC family response regulator
MPRQFMIIDDNRDGSFVLNRSLFGHFRTAAVHEYRDLESATDALRALPEDGGPVVVLTHRTAKLAGAELVRSIRDLHPRVPIIAMGDPGEEAKVLAAGATGYLDYAAWLRLGLLVKSLPVA